MNVKHILILTLTCTVYHCSSAMNPADITPSRATLSAMLDKARSIEAASKIPSGLTLEQDTAKCNALANNALSVNLQDANVNFKALEKTSEEALIALGKRTHNPARPSNESNDPRVLRCTVRHAYAMYMQAPEAQAKLQGEGAQAFRQAAIQKMITTPEATAGAAFFAALKNQ